MIYAITFAFIVLDFITGMVKAFASNSYSSTKMREGLYHKVGLVLCVILGVMVDYAQLYLELGFSVPVTAAVCGYIILMEIGSTVENIYVISPDLPEKLRELFGGVKKE